VSNYKGSNETTKIYHEEIEVTKIYLGENEVYSSVAQTFNNIITNGNFANGTTGWSGNGGALSAASNILSITGDGSTNDVYPGKTVSKTLATDMQLYFSVKMKAKGSLCASFQPYSSSPYYSFAYQSNPVQDNEYTFSDIWTITSGDNGKTSITLRLKSGYASAANANGQVTEIKEVILVDLTAAFGAGSEPTKAWCDANIPPNIVW
jgi:hypothetical protein